MRWLLAKSGAGGSRVRPTPSPERPSHCAKFSTTPPRSGRPRRGRPPINPLSGCPALTPTSLTQGFEAAPSRSFCGGWRCCAPGACSGGRAHAGAGPRAAAACEIRAPLCGDARRSVAPARHAPVVGRGAAAGAAQVAGAWALPVAWAEEDIAKRGSPCHAESAADVEGAFLPGRLGSGGAPPGFVAEGPQERSNARRPSRGARPMADDPTAQDVAPEGSSSSSSGIATIPSSSCRPSDGMGWVRLGM